MRIIAGRFKGMRLQVPRGYTVRPTTDRVRQAVFSALGEVPEGASVLDLFAGTGALGLEALSRGAKSLVLVEQDRRAAQVLFRTVRSLGLAEEVRILTMDALQAAKKLWSQGERFGLIFLDPPYGEDRLSPLMSLPAFLGLFDVGGILMVERSVRGVGPVIPESIGKVFSRRYGETLVELFRRDPEEASDFLRGQ